MTNVEIFYKGQRFKRIYIRYNEYNNLRGMDEYCISGTLELTMFLKLDLQTYIDLVKKHGGEIKNSFTMFDTKEKIDEFIKIIENIILMNQVGGLYDS